MLQDFVAPIHLLVEFDADLENFLEVVFVIVEQLVHLAVADQNNFYVNVNRFGLHRRCAERKKHIHGLNFELAVIESAFQRAPHANLGERVERIHHQEAAVRAQQGAATQIHEIGIPAAARVVAAMNRAKHVRVCGNRFENYGTFVLLAVSENHVHAIDAKRIAIGALGAGAAASLGGRLFILAFAFLEGIEIVENVVADFFQVFSDRRVRIFFLQLFNHAIHEHGSSFLLQIAHLAGQLARKRERLAVHDREFLAEAVIFPLELFGGGVFEFAVLHELGDFLDGHHLAFEHGKNFRQGYGAHLHAAQGKLLAGNAAREFVHQFLFARGEALDNARLLPLERLAFEHLRNAPPEKINSRFHFFLERVGRAAREREQTRPVGILEIVHVAAVGSGLALRPHFLDHAHDHAAAAGSRKTADK